MKKYPMWAILYYLSIDQFIDTLDLSLYLIKRCLKRLVFIFMYIP